MGEHCSQACLRVCLRVMPAGACRAGAVAHNRQVVARDAGLPVGGAQLQEELEGCVAAPCLSHLRVLLARESHLRVGKDGAVPLHVGGDPKGWPLRQRPQ